MGLDKRRHRAPWTASDEEELRQRVAAGQFLPQIAAEMGRSQEGVRTRANLLRLPIRFAAERRPRRHGLAEAEATPAIQELPQQS